MGFRLPTHRVAAAGAPLFYCWHHRPHCAGTQLNQLSILRPDHQFVVGHSITLSLFFLYSSFFFSDGKDGNDANDGNDENDANDGNHG